MSALLAPLALRDDGTSQTLRPWSIVDRIGMSLAVARAPERVRFAVWFSTNASEAGRIASAVRTGGVASARGMGERSPLPDALYWTEEALARAAGPDVARAAIRGAIGEVVGPLVSAWGFYVFVPLERRAPLADELRAEARAARRIR